MELGEEIGKVTLPPLIAFSAVQRLPGLSVSVPVAWEGEVCSFIGRGPQGRPRRGADAGRLSGTMASVGVAAGRQAEDTLPPPAEPPLPEMKPLPQPQPPPSVSAQQPQPAPKPPSPAGVKAEENCSFLPLVHSIIKW